MSVRTITPQHFRQIVNNGQACISSALKSFYKHGKSLTSPNQTRTVDPDSTRAFSHIIGSARYARSWGSGGPNFEALKVSE